MSGKEGKYPPPHPHLNFGLEVNLRVMYIAILNLIKFLHMYHLIGVMNGESETHQDAKTDILKSEPETKKCSDLIEKHICDRQTQNLRLQDPLVGSARFRDLDRICRDSHFLEDHSPPLFITLQLYLFCIYFFTYFCSIYL